jgi:hypothetical protein
MMIVCIALARVPIDEHDGFHSEALLVRCFSIVFIVDE